MKKFDFHITCANFIRNFQGHVFVYTRYAVSLHSNKTRKANKKLSQTSSTRRPIRIVFQFKFTIKPVIICVLHSWKHLNFTKKVRGLKKKVDLTSAHSSHRATSFPGSLLFTPHEVREGRPWLGLVTCLPEKNYTQGGVISLLVFVKI